MAEQIGKSAVYLVTGSAHPLMWSEPDAFRRTAQCFLDGL